MDSEHRHGDDRDRPLPASRTLTRRSRRERLIAIVLTLAAVARSFATPARVAASTAAPLVTDARFVAVAKSLCNLPSGNSVDDALAKLRARDEEPTDLDLWAARREEAAEAMAAPFADHPAVVAGGETYRLIASDDDVQGAARTTASSSPGPSPTAVASAAPASLSLLEIAAAVLFPRTPPVAGMAFPSAAAAALASPGPASPHPTDGPANGGRGERVVARSPSGTVRVADAPPDADATSAGETAPFPSPSATPFIPAALPGPGELVEPTPRSSAAATPSPPPIPTPSPIVQPTGPVYLSNPTGAPAIPDAGPSGAPFYAPTPGLPKGATPTPKPSASAQPRPIGTLAPNQIAILADKSEGSTHEHEPGEYDGNVHIFYAQGQIVGDHAHYDGDHTIAITGHDYLINRNQDTILYADEIDFDTIARRAVLYRGNGETTEGVDVGKLHYKAEKIQARGSNGATHADRATFTTCDKPHSGYHVNAKSIDVMPGDKVVARHATIFLGALAIFYIPLLIIPLRDIKDPRRQTQFLPIFGYSKTEGAYVMARLSFDEGNTYYGYYRVDYYTKRGLGLGYDAFIGTRNNRRQATIDAYTISDRITDTRQTNINATETENFANNLRSQLGVTYTGDFGAGIALPASLNLNGSLIHTGRVSTENLTFSRFVQGSLSDNYNLGLIDSLNLSPSLTQQFNFSYSKFNSQIASSDTFHINTLTHYFTKLADLNLKYDKTDFSAEPFGYDSVPELQVTPHIPFGGFRYPFTTELTVGEYTEPQNHFSTERVQGVLNYPVAVQLGQSAFNAAVNVTQDYYGTGDEKGFVTQNASLSTPFGNHVVNSVTYDEANPLGPSDVPFQLLDRLSGGSHSGQDVLRIFNGNVYSIQLSSGTNFDRQAQSVNYQISLRPSPRSLLLLGGYYQPGPGNGFYTTNVQGTAPLGPYTDIEYTTNVDYKNKFRLEDKNLYLTKIIDCCYRVQASYNQDLKQFNLSANLLAFPSQGIGIGSGQGQNAILPQSFAF